MIIILPGFFFATTADCFAGDGVFLSGGFASAVLFVFGVGFNLAGVELVLRVDVVVGFVGVFVAPGLDNGGFVEVFDVLREGGLVTPVGFDRFGGGFTIPGVGLVKDGLVSGFCIFDFGFDEVNPE